MSSAQSCPTLTNHDTFDVEKANSRSKSTLRWKNIGFAVKGRELPILHAIDGQVTSGELLAVMGPSGAGKSTFLEVLCKRIPALTGSIEFNGASDFLAKDVFSFVEQDDALYGVLTVRETVAYAAQLSYVFFIFLVRFL